MTLKSFDYKTNKFPDQYEVVKSITLQYTDMLNGNNKFFHLELHKNDYKDRIYSRYGRTGASFSKEEERFPCDYGAERQNAKI